MRGSIIRLSSSPKLIPGMIASDAARGRRLVGVGDIIRVERLEPSSQLQIDSRVRPSTTDALGRRESTAGIITAIDALLHRGSRLSAMEADHAQH